MAMQQVLAVVDRGGSRRQKQLARWLLHHPHVQDGVKALPENSQQLLQAWASGETVNEHGRMLGFILVAPSCVMKDPLSLP